MGLGDPGRRLRRQRLRTKSKRGEKTNRDLLQRPTPQRDVSGAVKSLRAVRLTTEVIGRRHGAKAAPG